MNTHAEKRTCERHCYSADIAVSYFNKEHSYDAHTLNIGTIAVPPILPFHISIKSILIMLIH